MKRIVKLGLLALLTCSLLACSSETCEISNEYKVNDIIKQDEIIAIDEEEFKMTIEVEGEDDGLGYALDTKIENKSSDKAYNFELNYALVNGVQCDCIFALKVEAGEKSNDAVVLLTQTLNANGITDFTHIVLSMSVYDLNNPEADCYNKIINIYPKGEDKATRYEKEKLDEDVILVDNELVEVIATGYEYREGGFLFQLYITNKDSHDIILSNTDERVNDCIIETGYSSLIPANASKFDSMFWYQDHLDEYNIDVVEEIKMKLKAYYEVDRENSIMDENIVYNPR